MFQRAFLRAAKPKKFVRQMGGGHAPPPEGGIDGLVRGYLPKDYQLVLAILGLYTSFYFVSKLLSFGKKPKAVAAIEAAPVSSAVNSSSMPSPDSPDFEKWVNTPGNLENYLADCK